MGDRTNITDARQHDAEQAAGVIEQAMRIVDHIDKAARLMGEIITEALDAAGFDVVLRADPDTSDEHKPCPHCNDEGVVCTLDGEIIGPCDCTSDDLFTEARRLLDAYPEDVFESPPQDWKAGMVTGTVPDAVDEDGYLDVWITPDAFAAHVLRKIALPVIAALLAERDADVSAGAVARTVAMSHIAAERDAERVARERAEAEARQLREAIEDRLRQVLAVHGQFLGDWDEWTSLGALEGYNGLTVTARTALAHLHGRHDDSPLPTMHCVLCETFRVPAVAEGAEDRGQTHTQTEQPTET